MNNNYNDLDTINEELAGIWPGWEAVKLLGKGASGAVYEIHRDVRSNQEKAAMKVLRVPNSTAELEQLHFQGMELQNTEEYYGRHVDDIQNEIRIMQNFVGNSHIVSYEDYLICKRQDSIGWDIYIRMELLTGLMEYIKNNPLDEKRVIKLGADILLGMRDCHNSGIIHRDIKPGNIFVNKAGNFKLGDFGIARTTPESDDILSFKGTLGYMAPEVYRRESTDERTDIYSLGMVLYQCLNENRLPFVPKNFLPEDVEKARRRRLDGEQIPPPAHGSDGLKAVVLKSLADRPEDRYQTAEEMYYALGEVYRAEYGSKRNTGAGAGSRSGGGNNNVAGKEKDSSSKSKLIIILPLVLAAAVILFLVKGYFNKQPDSVTPADSTPTKTDERPVEETVAQQAETPQAQPAELAEEDAADVQERPAEEAEEAAEEDMQERPAEEEEDAVEDAQEQSSEEEEEMSEDTQDQPAETVDPDMPDFVVDWNDDALEAKMRKITGIGSGDILFSDVRGITTLDLGNADEKAADDVKIRDIDALSDLKNLKILKLNNNRIEDISALGSLSNLEELSLDSNKVEDISALSGLTNLEELDLSHNQVENISVLSDLTDLERLYLFGNRISDISALRNLTKLDKLSLARNEIEDLSPLTNLMKLTRLYLYSNQVQDISALSNLTSLDKLSLGDNQIEDIRALSNLTNLKRLYLYDNRISDISALSCLTNLVELSLDGNQITDYSPIENLHISSLKK